MYEYTMLPLILLTNQHFLHITITTCKRGRTKNSIIPATLYETL